MGKVQAANIIIENYRKLASSPNINDLNGRVGRPHVTAFLADNIATLMMPQEGETVVDIGCGDASVLRRMVDRENRARYIGILPTNEEVARVAAHINSDHISIVLGRAEQTGLSTDVADKVVCNGVLILVPDVDAALAEIARIARQGATIFLGEVPHCDEQQRDASIAETNKAASSLAHRIVARLRTEGPVAIWRKIRYLMIGRFQPLPPRLFHAPPEAFIKMASNHGFRTVWCRPNGTLDAKGDKIESATRTDYFMIVERKTPAYVCI